MNKKEIFEKLNKLEIDKNNYIVVGDASLVCQGIIKECDIIDVT